MRRLIAACVLALAAAPAAAVSDDLNLYIAGQAAGCWTTPEALRGIRVAATLEVQFRQDGHVDLVRVVDATPESATSRALAGDMAAALERCGPYATEGMRDITVTMSWPM
jgi:hypothetical protein